MLLYGREAECAQLDELLERIRAGDGVSLVVRGAPGAGKTTLLDHAAARAAGAGCAVARAAGVESEMELAFAGLQQLIAPVLGFRERLPAAQRAALETAVGLRAGRARDRLLVGLSVLGLLAEAARERPLLCVVDDVQSLDRASAEALAFAARRLVAESVAIAFGLRDDGAAGVPAGLAELPALVVGPLRDADARALLAAHAHAPLDRRVLERFLAEARGNPLALLELPAAGALGLPGVPPPGSVTGRIAKSFEARLAALPRDTRRLLLVAAAEPVGDPAVVARAAATLGVPAGAARAAQDAGLAEVGERVRFGHPLIRSAAYRTAPAADRRRAHAALAGATDPEADPDRRAWHRAQAADGPDEAVAAELERCAGRAAARGGLAAAAAFLTRAAELTDAPHRRTERSLAAAQAQLGAGAPAAAAQLLGATVARPALGELERARAEVLRAQLAFAREDGGAAPALLLGAAARLAPLDPARARDTCLEAFAAAMFVGRPAEGVGVAEVAAAARALPAPGGPPRPADRLLDALAALFSHGGPPAGIAGLRRALDGFGGAGEDATALWLACRAAMGAWDAEAWDRLSAHGLAQARDTGNLTALPPALSSRLGFLLHAGDVDGARALGGEIAAVTAAGGSDIRAYAELLLAAWQGDEAEADALARRDTAELALRGDGVGMTVVWWAQALMYNSLGRPAEAMAVAARAGAHHEQLGVSAWGLAELVEAAARGGDRPRAVAAFARLEAITRAAGTDWALGVRARSRALLGGDGEAEAHYREALERLARTPAAAMYLARTRLLYGEWLRRRRRRRDARAELAAAQEHLSAIGMRAFAQRAERELLGTGATARSRRPGTRARLTPQELQVARLAREGLSNPDIGSRLFLSARTVEYHLGRVFAKLGISSRASLHRVLEDDDAPVSGGR